LQLLDGCCPTLQVVFTVSTAVQLLGAGLCGGDAPFTASLMLEEVQPGPSDEQIADAIDPEARAQPL
jgi:hypothetical protein